MKHRVKRRNVTREGVPVIAKIIYETRVEHNLDCKGFAELLGISRSMVTYLELGRCAPSFELAVKIATFASAKQRRAFVDWLAIRLPRESYHLLGDVRDRMVTLRSPNPPAPEMFQKVKAAQNAYPGIRGPFRELSR